MKPLLLISLGLFILAGCAGSASQQPRDRGKDGLPFYYLALANIEQGDFPAALANLDSSIYYKPTLAQSHQLKGWVYERLGEIDSAISAYQRGLEYKSHFPDIWVRLGQLLLKTGSYADAATYLKKSVDYYPDSTRFYLGLAEAHYWMNRPALTLDDLRAYEGAASSPLPAYWKWLGLADYKLKRFTDARQALEKYLSLGGSDALAYKILGLTLFELADYHKAVSYLNSAEQLSGFDPEVVVFRARYFKRFNKESAAWQELEDGLQRDSSSVLLLMEAGIWEYERQNFPAADGYFHKVLQSDETAWLAHRYLGLVAEQEGRPSDAIAHYQRYLQNTYRQDTEITARLKKLQAPPRE